MSEGKKWPQYAIAVIVNLGALANGTAIGYTANITTELREGALNGLKIENDDQLGWVGSLIAIGAMIMCFPSGWMADGLGRKWSMLMLTVPYVTGWGLILVGKYLLLVYAGRILIGIACGGFCVLAPLYVSEIAETSIRGTLGAFFQLFIVIGIAVAYIAGAFLPMVAYNLLCLSIPVIFFVIYIFQPESPIYLLKKGRTEEAIDAYKRLRGSDYNAAPEIKSANEQIEKQKSLGNFFTAMKTKAAKKATLVMFMLMFYQQFSGINSVMFYSKDIFIDAKSTLDPAYCTIIIGIVQVLATIFATWAIDVFGRKILLDASAASMALSCTVLGIYFYLKNRQGWPDEDLSKIGWLPITALVVYIIGFSLGLGPIPWAASPEIFPPEVVAKMTSAAATLNWCLAFSVAKGYPPVANAIGNDITFFIFAIIMISCVVFTTFVIPETKGKTFAEIQAILEG